MGSSSRQQWALDVAADSNPGIRLRQEDAFGFVHHNAAVRSGKPERAVVTDARFVVADGHGVLHQCGVEAAEAAVRHALRYPAHAMEGLAEFTRANLVAAQAAVLAAQKSPQKAGMTTAALLVVRGGQGCVGWVGDSRVYRLRWTHGRHVLTCLTKDHRAADGTLLRRLGSLQGVDSATPDIVETDMQVGDVFALVTDGVWDALGHTGIREVLTDMHAGPVAVLTAKWAAESLVEKAMQRGRRDNATALVVLVKEASHAG